MGEPWQTPLGAHHRAGGCYAAGGCGGFWGQSQVGGDLGEPVPGWGRWVDSISGAAACPGGGSLAASSFPSPVCGAIRRHGCRCHGRSPAPSCRHCPRGPLPLQLHPPTRDRSWSPLALWLCSQREMAKTPSRKIRAEAWPASRAGVNLFLGIQELYVAAGGRERSGRKTRGCQRREGFAHGLRHGSDCTRGDSHLITQPSPEEKQQQRQVPRPRASVALAALSIWCRSRGGF